jgi:hypothetical protein
MLLGRISQFDLNSKNSHQRSASLSVLESAFRCVLSRETAVGDAILHLEPAERGRTSGLLTAC